MKEKLWCDLKTPQEKADYIRSGMAWREDAITEEVAVAFEALASISEKTAAAFDAMKSELEKESEKMRKPR
jgi:hypothetical protein